MNVDDLIGIPYVPRGRTLKGLDCWGLALVVMDRFGVQVQDVLAWADDESVKAQQAQMPSERWIAERFKGWRRIEKPEPGCAVVFKNVDGSAVHIGIMVDEQYFIHTMRRTGSVITRLAREPWCSRLCGVYAYGQ